MAEPQACSSERVIQDVSPRNPAAGSMAHQWSALSVNDSAMFHMSAHRVSAASLLGTH